MAGSILKHIRIISGGQTGVDQAALQAAKCAGLPTGGWVPRGFQTETGPLPVYLRDFWNLLETPSSLPEIRTEWNVRDSSATLILSPFPLEGGTLYTFQMIQKHRKWYCVVNFTPGCAHEDHLLQDVRKWLQCVRPEVLNVAGPRLSRYPWIYEEARFFLMRLFWTPVDFTRQN